MKLYNTLTRQIDELQPLDGNKVKLYTCGLTVYNQPHIGNWVGYIYWDVLVRTLRQQGYDVERTQNYTDVGHMTSDDDSGEDKMEKRARSEGITAWDIAQKYIAVADYEAYDLLGLIRPDHLIRATDYIQQQIDFAKILEAKGFTYIIPNEGIYFDTSKLNDYGKLARLDIAGLEAGARVEIKGKRNITDFAIWKFSPTGKQRDMEWDSPWGKGFPGWHLECSVIARETLGDQIDIHTGGIDHIPVHHTNEIAQTEAVTDKRFSQLWVHNNHLKADGQKMSKSIGNIYTLQDILDKGYRLDAFKLMVLAKHYTTEGNFTWQNLESAQNRVRSWRSVAELRWQTTDSGDDGQTEIVNNLMDKAADALANDLDTSGALMFIDEAFDQFKTDNVSHFALNNLITFIDSNLGLGLQKSTPDIDDDIRSIITERQQARVDKDFAKSDALRQDLLDHGIEIIDATTNQIWSRI